MPEKMKAHSAAQYWTPDEVAEALDGISMATSRRLWELMGHMEPKPARSEWPEPPAREHSVLAIWERLTDAERQEINAALAKSEDPGDDPSFLGYAGDGIA